MNLVIIEGVGKKDTIQKYLGKDYEVVASQGHVRDLPEKTLGVNIRNNFEPEYAILPDKKDIVEKLKKKASKADKIYIATDPDREGEAIAWHLCYILGLNPKDPIRITFNEITHDAVQNGLHHPRSLDLNLVDAQQTRRVLDRLVGYKLSEIMCRKIQPKLSAGRVQSTTLKMVVDRENEIRNFVPKEYWTLTAQLYNKDPKQIFKATLTKIKGKKHTVEHKEDMDKIVAYLQKYPFVVKNVKKSVGKTHPTAPYTTSTMQQDALNKLGMSVKKTTACAQALYEGVELGSEGKIALVTYIRSDSTRVAPEAMAMAKEYIKKNFGEKYLPKTQNIYKTKSSAQDAHEAIRPINLNRTPESVKNLISPDNYKLYRMIYQKFLASQMADSTHNSVVADISCGECEFRASGKTPLFDGFTIVYAKDKKPKIEETIEEDESQNGLLPEMAEQDILTVSAINPMQKFTKAPSRYTEATLIKEMEDKGIGRPATYAPTLSTIASRNYTEKEGKYLVPTKLGEAVSAMLEKFFGSIINVKFTADMESKLDQVAEEGIDWHQIIKEFYAEFEKFLYTADKDSVKIKVEPKPTNYICDKCGSPMVIRTGKFGEFIACSNFPKCKNILNIVKTVGVCPKCGKDVIEKKSKKGKVFYGCSDYPKCDFVSWEIPVEEKCPKCGSYMTKKELYGKIRIKCSNAQCDYQRTEEKEKKKEENQSV